MRCYITRENDTLEDLALRFYYVLPAHDNAEQARHKNLLKTVMHEIQKAPGNEGLVFDALSAGQRVFLPDIKNVKRRDPSREFWSFTNWFIGIALVLAFFCALSWTFLELIYQAAAGIGNTLGEGAVQTFVLQTVAVRPVTVVTFLQTLVLTALAIFVVWFLQLPKRTAVHTTLIYFVIWVVGATVISVLVSVFSYWVSLTLLANSFIDFFDYLAAWSVLVAILYVVVGDNTNTYRANIKEHKEIYVCFLLTILYTAIILNYTYDYINQRIEGLLAPRELLSAHLDDAALALNRAEVETLKLETRLSSGTFTSNFETKECSLETNSRVPSRIENTQGGSVDTQPLSNSATKQQIQLRRSELFPICANLRSAALSTQAALYLYPVVQEAETELANELAVASGITPTNQLGASIKWTEVGATDSLALTKEISTSLGEVDASLDLAQTDSNRLETNLYSKASIVTTHELLPRIRQARTAAAHTAAAVRGVEIDPRPIFNGSAALMVLFVLFPWFLLLMFFLRKRTSLASAIVKDLIRLAPNHALLNRVLGLMRVQVGTDEPPTQNSETYEQESRLHGIDHEQIRRQSYLVESVRALPNHSDGEIRGQNISKGVAAYENVKNAIANHAFSDLEYVLAITLLSGAFAVGWYFVLYPLTTIGLALLILENSGIIGFVNYLKANLTTITTGFIGAYVWSTFTLLRRYYYGDLYPAAYLAALERMIRVFVITLVLTVAGALIGFAPGVTGDNDFKSVAILLLAFFIGIFPQVGLTFIGDSLNKILGSRFPSLEQRAPLTKLDGMDYYFEGRLLEEKIENIQGMATAQIEDLVLNTYFPAKRVVDWIDQALLYVHCGHEGERFEPFRSAGIRTASDFLDALGYGFEDSDSEKRELPAPDETLVKRMVDAVNKGEPADKALTSDIVHEIYDAMFPDPNMRYVLYWNNESVRRES